MTQRTTDKLPHAGYHVVLFATVFQKTVKTAKNGEKTANKRVENGAKTDRPIAQAPQEITTRWTRVS